MIRIYSFKTINIKQTILPHKNYICLRVFHEPSLTQLPKWIKHTSTNPDFLHLNGGNLPYQTTIHSTGLFRCDDGLFQAFPKSPRISAEKKSITFSNSDVQEVEIMLLMILGSRKNPPGNNGTLKVLNSGTSVLPKMSWCCYWLLIGVFEHHLAQNWHFCVTFMVSNHLESTSCQSSWVSVNPRESWWETLPNPSCSDILLPEQCNLRRGPSKLDNHGGSDECGEIVVVDAVVTLRMLQTLSNRDIYIW